MTAVVVAEATADGRTRCSTLRSSPPISLRETPDGLYLVASGAGPLGGDRLRLDIEVAAGARLVVRSSGASLALPGPTGAPARFDVRARVAGSLTWTPEPTVLVAGCDLLASTSVALSGSGRLCWRETVVLGRHAEPSGSMLLRLDVERDGRPLHRNELPLGPRWPGAQGRAGTDGARAVSSTLVVGGPAPAAPGGAVLRLADDAWLAVEAHRPEGRTGRGEAVAVGPAGRASQR